MKKLRALGVDDPPSLSELCPELPKPLVATVHRMIGKSPDDRFRNPAQVADALASFCVGHNLRALLRRISGDPVQPDQAHDEGSTNRVHSELNNTRGQRILVSDPNVEQPTQLATTDEYRGKSAAAEDSNYSQKRIVVFGIGGTIAVIALVVAVVSNSSDQSTDEKTTGNERSHQRFEKAKADSQTPKLSQLAAYSDEFNNENSLENWSILRRVPAQHPRAGAPVLDSYDLGRTRPGWLTLYPSEYTGWYIDGVGALISRRVKGDFIASTRVHVFSREDSKEPPSKTFNMAGLIVRDPNPDGLAENWVFAAIGQQATTVGIRIEGSFQSRGFEMTEDTEIAEAQLRLCRLGDTYHAFCKTRDDQEWRRLNMKWRDHTIRDRIQRNRSDETIPDTLEVGIMRCFAFCGQSGSLNWTSEGELSDVQEGKNRVRKTSPELHAGIQRRGRADAARRSLGSVCV